MNERGRKPIVSSRAPGGAPEPFRSLLVPLDLTPSSDRVVGRLARLPLARGARVTLLHVVPDTLAARERRSARRDAAEALAAEAGHLRESFPGTVIVEPLVKVGSAAKEIAACAKVAKAELIVMGRVGGRAIRDVFLGSTAERVIRRGQLPVLVVRLPPRRAYRRPALALDLDQCADHVLGLMLRLLQPPRPRVEVIHAFEAPYHRLVYPSIPREAAEESKRKLQLEASRKLAALLAESLARAKVLPEDSPIWKTHLRYGSPRFIIPKVVKTADTDLLVLGTHGYSGVAHMFLGTVAGDVVRGVACDVLIVPPRSPQ